MGLYVHNENPNAFVRTMRKIYNPIGFKKGYNFILFFISKVILWTLLFSNLSMV